MKKIILLFFLISALLHVSRAGIKVVERPVVGNSNTTIVDILKIELSESATVLWLDIYNCAGEWINILSQTVLQSTDGERTYKLLGCDGLEINKRIIIPQQGYVSCKLTFEPLAAGEEAINYVEGPGTGTWFMGDIRLVPGKAQPAKHHCLLRGEVRDRPYSGRLLLTKSGGDSRVVGQTIPIRNGRFEYLLAYDDCEAYDLIFEDEQCSGSWMPITFFADSDTVDMVLYPKEQYEKNSIRGGAEDRNYRTYLQLSKEAVPLEELSEQMEQLSKENKYFTEEAEALMKAMSETRDRKVADSLYQIFSELRKEDKQFTPEALILVNTAKALTAKLKSWSVDYIRENPSLACYHVLLRDFARYLQSRQDEDWESAKAYSHMDETRVKKIVDEVYRPLYPKHPYTAAMDGYFKTLENIYVGGQYIDFTAPDLFTGEEVVLSDQIRGRVALIDLWASWCGPCRMAAMKMIPVYEKYKDKGFTVVGVARERSLITGQEAAKKDKYPWVNLLELSDRQGIWGKYGVGNAGGCQFLVGKDGKIVAINPSVEEVIHFLEQQ